MTVREGEAGTGGGLAEGELPDELAEPGTRSEKGYWPGWWEKFRNDFRSAKAAKANDGMKAPHFPRPAWGDKPGSRSEILLEASRRRHEQAEARIEKAEARAVRLTQAALSFLTLALVATGFQATRLRIEDSPILLWVLALTVAGGAVVCIAVAAVQAIGVDRVGYVQPPDPGQAAEHETDEEQRGNLIMQEFRAAQMANWTARNKVNEFLQARAWMTRGVTLLAVSGVLAVLIWATTGELEEKTPIPPAVDITTSTTNSTATLP